jgi:hypothetical protein
LEKADTRYSKVSALVGADTFCENNADTDTDTFDSFFINGKMIFFNLFEKIILPEISIFLNLSDIYIVFYI